MGFWVGDREVAGRSTLFDTRDGTLVALMVGDMIGVDVRLPQFPLPFPIPFPLLQLGEEDAVTVGGTVSQEIPEGTGLRVREGSALGVGLGTVDG